MIFLCRYSGYYLIAISDEIKVLAKEIDIRDVLDSPLYTLAWFSEIDMLSSLFIHKIGKVSVSDDFSDRAGMLIDANGNIIINNCGQRATWRHEFRAFALKETTVADVMTVKYVPKTVI